MSRSGPRTLLAALLAVAGPARAASAEDAATPPAGPSAPPSLRTRLEAGVLPRSAVVVIGRVRVLVPPRGMGSATVLRVEVEKALKGTTEPAFTLFVGGARNTNDPARPAEAYFADPRGGRYALFLAPTPNGSGFALEATFSVDDVEGREKAEVLERELAVVARPDPAERDRRLVDLVLDLIGSERPWSRLHGARELEAIAAHDPSLIGAAAQREIAAVARRTFDGALRGRLEKVLAAAEAVPTAVEPTSTDASGRGERPPPPEYFQAVRRLRETADPAVLVPGLSELARLGRRAAAADLLPYATTAASPEVRERATVLLGDVGARERLDALQARFSEEPEQAVREAIVRAVGLLGDEGDVAWLVARLGTPAWVRPVAFALARIRTENALGALGEIAGGARQATPPDDALGRLVEYLRTPAFVEAERVAGRSVGPRPRRTPSPVPGDAAHGGGQPPDCPPREATNPR